MIKVLTPKIGLDGCSWYRTRQPLAKAEELKLIELKELDPDKQSEEEMAKMIKTCDVLYIRFSMIQASFVIKNFIEQYPLKPVVFDIDDDYFNINPLNDFYEVLGIKEVYADGKPLWTEGKFFDPYRNRKRMIDYEYCLRHATVVTVTTEKLAQMVRNYNKNVIVIPNCINPNLFPRVEIKHDDLRLLWSGGSSHYPDLVSVRKDIERLMKEYPTLNLYIYGQTFNGIFQNINKDRVHYKGWISAEGHGYRLATVGADVSICPLIENEFNSNKSSIKFYETAAIGIPTVAKKMLPYSEDIKHGETGFLYTDDLYKQVKKLLDDSVLRKNIADKAYEWVIKNRHYENQAKDMVKMFSSLQDALRTDFVDL